MGTTFAELLPFFQSDERTDGVICLGEIGTVMEEEAAEVIKSGEYKKPLVAYIAGKGLPSGLRFSHASAIVEEGRGSAEGKMKALQDVGAYVVNQPEDIRPGYRHAHADLALEFENLKQGNFGDEWKKALPTFGADTGAMATREASGKILNAIAPHLLTLIGGSADLTPSNNTFLKNYPEFQANVHTGRNFHFGVREHAMGSILNGLALTEG